MKKSKILLVVLVSVILILGSSTIIYGYPFADADVTDEFYQRGVNIKWYGAVGDGSTNDAPAIQSAINAMSGADTEFIFPIGTYRVGNNLDFPLSISVIFKNGAKLSVDAGITVTINGTLLAGLHHIFDGSGDIIINSKIESIYPQWFGAFGGSTDNSSQIQKAINSIDTSSSRTNTIFFVGAAYKFNSIIMNTGIRIVGVGGAGASWTYFEYNGNTTGDLLTWDGSVAGGGGLINILIGGGTGTTGTAIKLYATDQTHRPGEFVIHNVLVDGSTNNFGRGLVIDGTNANTPGSKGVRSVYLDKFRVAGCSITDQYILINQAVHLISSYLGIDTGAGTGIAGMTITGDSEDIVLNGVDFSGKLTIDGNSRNVLVTGHVDSQFCVNSSTCENITFNGDTTNILIADGAKGVFMGTATGTITNPNEAKFRVLNVETSRIYVGNQIVGGGYTPAAKTKVNPSSNYDAFDVFTAYPLDATLQQAGYYAYNPVTSNSMIARVNKNKAEFGSTNNTPVDLIYGGSAKASVDSEGLKTQSSSWNGAHFRLGNYHLWVDASGNLRIKSSTPISDTDGTIVGTQQ